MSNWSANGNAFKNHHSSFNILETIKKKKKAIRIKNIATYNSKKKKTYRNFDDSFFTDDNNSEEGRGGGRGGESGNLVIAKKITEGQNNIQN